MPEVTSLISVMNKVRLNTQYGYYSTTVYMVKMESVSEITIFGQKVIVKSGLELFIFEIPPCGKKVIFVNDFLVVG